MDLNRLISMLTRLFIKTAVNTGVDHAARKGKPEADMTPEERLEAKRAKEIAKRAQQIARITRRFGR